MCLQTVLNDIQNPVGGIVLAHQLQLVVSLGCDDGDHIGIRAEARAGRKDLRGMVFCVSGRLATFTNHDHLNIVLAPHGALLRETVTTGVDYLVAAEDTGKIARAEQLGIEIITEEELNRMLLSQEG